MATKNDAKFQKALNQVEDAKKSLEKVKSANVEKSTKANDAEKADEVKKNVKDMNISTANGETAKKKAKSADEAEKCGEDEVDETAHTSAKERAARDEATKDIAEDTKAPVYPKTPDKAKEIDKIEDKKGHEQASKSLDTELLMKSFDAILAANDAYKSIVATKDATIKSLQTENANLRKSLAQPTVEKSAKKDVNDPDANDIDGEDNEDEGDATKCGGHAKKCDTKAKKSTTEKCDNEEKCGTTAAQDQQASKAKKSKTEKCDADGVAEKCGGNKAKKCDPSDDIEASKKSVQKSDDEVAKSMPQGKGVANPEATDSETDSQNDEAEKSVKMGDLKDVLLKSISAFTGSFDSVNRHKEIALKSMYADVKDLNDEAPVSDKMIKAYNRI